MAKEYSVNASGELVIRETVTVNNEEVMSPARLRQKRQALQDSIARLQAELQKAQSQLVKINAIIVEARNRGLVISDEPYVPEVIQ